MKFSLSLWLIFLLSAAVNCDDGNENASNNESDNQPANKSNQNNQQNQGAYVTNQGVRPYSYGYNTGIQPYSYSYNYPTNGQPQVQGYGPPAYGPPPVAPSGYPPPPPPPSGYQPQPINYGYPPPPPPPAYGYAPQYGHPPPQGPPAPPPPPPIQFTFGNDGLPIFTDPNPSSNGNNNNNNQQNNQVNQGSPFGNFQFPISNQNEQQRRPQVGNTFTDFGSSAPSFMNDTPNLNIPNIGGAPSPPALPSIGNNNNNVFNPNEFGIPIANNQPVNNNQNENGGNSLPPGFEDLGFGNNGIGGASAASNNNNAGTEFPALPSLGDGGDDFGFGGANGINSAGNTGAQSSPTDFVFGNQGNQGAGNDGFDFGSFTDNGNPSNTNRRSNFDPNIPLSSEITYDDQPSKSEEKKPKRVKRSFFGEPKHEKINTHNETEIDDKREAAEKNDTMTSASLMRQQQLPDLDPFSPYGMLNLDSNYQNPNQGVYTNYPDYRVH